MKEKLMTKQGLITYPRYADGRVARGLKMEMLLELSRRGMRSVEPSLLASFPQRVVDDMLSDCNEVFIARK